MTYRLDQPLADVCASEDENGACCGPCTAVALRKGADVVLDELRSVPATWTVVEALEYLTFDHAPIEGVPE